MQDTVLRGRYRTTGGMEKVVMHNTSACGRGARVALCSQPTQSNVT